VRWHAAGYAIAQICGIQTPFCGTIATTETGADRTLFPTKARVNLVKPDSYAAANQVSTKAGSPDRLMLPQT
jgi:hypothetical protein